MLSVLIPTYHYNTYPLVKEIHSQCENSNIAYEIIVLDDYSIEQIYLQENRKINGLSHSRFEENKSNLGRAKNRNLLAQKAKYEWLLFMDCDTFPKKKNYISHYVDEIKKNTHTVFYGGICYEKKAPSKEKILRWKYGKYREEIAIDKRKSNPYQSTLTSNILIHKSIFEKITFEEKIIEYGYEDLVFVSKLKKNDIYIQHIENPTYHLNYETSELFLIKTEKSLQNLKWIYTNKLIENCESKIIEKWFFLKKTHLHKPYEFLFKKLHSKVRKHILSEKPSLLVLDLYKLGYFCFINMK